MSSFLIIGATGNVGREVVKQLRQRGVSFRVTNHRTEKVGEQEVYLDLWNPETFLPGLAGIEKIFLIRPPQIADAQSYFLPFIQAAKQQGVKQIVFLSVMGVENLPMAPHAKIETYIREANIGYTFLRPSFFLQNLVTEHIDELRQDNTLYIPSGEVGTSLIDTRDIGEAAALSLLDSQHINKSYTLTGSESLSYYQVAQILSEELGRSIAYANPSPEQFSKHMLAKGVPAPYVEVTLGVYFIARSGITEAVTPDLEALLGHPAKTVRDFVRDYRDQF